ncbi:hypothetical protein NMY22_g5148 [Coprinellus aureogranulatus]|nr:hypothetical protein NMY22_g5148 [Coprinellus aureogranulatus]
MGERPAADQPPGWDIKEAQSGNLAPVSLCLPHLVLGEAGKGNIATPSSLLALSAPIGSLKTLQQLAKHRTLGESLEIWCQNGGANYTASVLSQANIAGKLQTLKTDCQSDWIGFRMALSPGGSYGFGSKSTELNPGDYLGGHG